MHVSSIHLVGFKRFTDTQFTNIPSSAKLVILAGPNGSGKSSIFEGFRTWHFMNGLNVYGWDEDYGTKVGSPAIGWNEHVSMTFHEPIPELPDDKKRLIYIRTAFRNQADFAMNSFSRLESPLDNPSSHRLIDPDLVVAENYQRLIMQTLDGVYDETIPDETPKSVIRDRIIGRVRSAMLEVFPDLVLAGVGALGSSTGKSGTFYFNKGASTGFLYKNLSAGEKAAFDLILDAVVKSEFYYDSIWCIDEPETHLNTRIQGRLLSVLLDLVPDSCQLWLASHSLGFMRKSWEIAKEAPESVAFLDLENIDFDETVTVAPVKPSRAFWARTLSVAMGDMASLVAPEQIILCEGRIDGGNGGNSAFDAECYRRIFAEEHPETDFISVGNARDTVNDRLGIGQAIQTISAGTLVSRVIDRDHRSPQEVIDLETAGVRVLPKRHLEAYLFDPEIIESLCVREGRPDLVGAARQIYTDAIAASVSRGNDSDDIKRAAGDIVNGLRKLLALSSAGSSVDAFGRDTMAALVRPGTNVYAELQSTIFD